MNSNLKKTHTTREGFPLLLKVDPQGIEDLSKLARTQYLRSLHKKHNKLIREQEATFIEDHLSLLFRQFLAFYNRFDKSCLYTPKSFLTLLQNELEFTISEGLRGSYQYLRYTAYSLALIKRQQALTTFNYQFIRHYKHTIEYKAIKHYLEAYGKTWCYVVAIIYPSNTLDGGKDMIFVIRFEGEAKLSCIPLRGIDHPSIIIHRQRIEREINERLQQDEQSGELDGEGEGEGNGDGEGE